jgi:hypothetical protein
VVAAGTEHRRAGAAGARIEGIPLAGQLGAVDPELTARAYIVPGLGDAGDLAFGAKD